MIAWLAERKKAIGAALAAAPAIAAYWVPTASDDVKKGCATVVLALGVLGVHGLRNRNRNEHARR